MGLCNSFRSREKESNTNSLFSKIRDGNIFTSLDVRLFFACFAIGNCRLYSNACLLFFERFF